MDFEARRVYKQGQRHQYLSKHEGSLVKYSAQSAQIVGTQLLTSGIHFTHAVRVTKV
jgi:hypothetical protein